MQSTIEKALTNTIKKILQRYPQNGLLHCYERYLFISLFGEFFFLLVITRRLNVFDTHVVNN